MFLQDIQDRGVHQLDVTLERGRDGVRECPDGLLSRGLVSEDREVGIEEVVRLLDIDRETEPVASWRDRGRL